MEKPKLRPYQREDVIKLSKLRCTACLNEQRTGKTPTSLVTMKVQKHQKILIVCPGTASYDWKEKFELWLDRPCIVLDGTPKQREEKLKQWTDGLVITYDTLKIINHYDPADKDLPKKKRKVTHKTGELTHLLKHKIDAVIVDEFHRARNRKTLTAKSLYKLATIVPYRMALTGTPAYSENTDIWSMLHFLYPAKFDNYWKFVDEYFTITMKWTPNGMARNIGAMRPEKEKKLQAFLDQIATQRKQHDKDVMSWLPDSPEPRWIKLPATAQQQKHLDTLMEFYETDTVICKNTLDRLIRYRQICQDPRLLNLKGGSAKTNWLRQFYSDYPNAPAIVFSNFTSYLELLAAECPTTHALITGNITNQERKIIEQRFQNGEIQTLFINIKAGKETLTLDRAEHKIFLDVFTPIGDITQASSRFTPTCEERKSIPKTIWYLMLKDTFDEEIYYALETAKTTTDILNNFKLYLE